MKSFFKNLEVNIIAFLLIMMCILVNLSTFGRYTGLLYIKWADEITRYMYIWLAFLGAGIAEKQGAHFRVEAFVTMLPKSWQHLVTIIANILEFVFLAMVIFYSVGLLKLQMNMGQLSPMLHIPIWTIYLALPVGALSMCVQIIFRVFNNHEKEKKKETEVDEI